MGGPQLTTFLISFASFINMLIETRERWKDATPPPPPLNIEGHTKDVNSAAVFPDGKRVVTASRDKTAKVWDVESGTVIITLEGHTEEVRSAAVFPDGKRVVTASADKTAKVWDLESGEEICTLEGHDGVVFSASPVRNGTAVITAGFDKKIILHDRLAEAPVSARGNLGGLAWATRDSVASWTACESEFGLDVPKCHMAVRKF